MKSGDIMDNLILKHTKSLLFFLFFTIGLIITLVLNYDYNNYNAINQLEITELNNISGTIVKIRRHKTKYEIFLDSTNIEFVTNEDLAIKKDDYVTIYYYKEDSFRNNETHILELRTNDEILYSFEQYKEKYNPNLYFYTILIISIIDIILFILGLIMIKFPYDDNLVRAVFIHSGKDNKLSEKEINVFLKNLNNPINNEEKLNIEKEELVNIFKQSIYTKNNKYYTSAMQYIDNSFYEKVFNEVLFDFLEENEFKIIYDDGLIDESGCFCVYKLNNKLVCIYMFIEDDGNFLIDNSCFNFKYPRNVKMNKKEKEQFYNVLKDYLLDIYE